MYTLDEILNATPTNDGPTVVRENHDLSQISTEGMGSAVAADPSDGIRSQMAGFRSQIADLESGRGGWDEAEYGRSRGEQIARFKRALEQAEAALAESESEAGRAKAALLIAEAQQELVRRAVNRANLDTSNGRVNVVLARKAGWHKLGVVMSDVFDAETAMRVGGLDWQVEKVPYLLQDGSSQDYAYYIRRTDTGAVLAPYAGPQWTPIQNAEGFKFLDNVLCKVGAKYDTAGSLFGGRKVFAQAVIPGFGFKLGNVDESVARITWVNSHVPGEAAFCFPTVDRTVCLNTVRLAVIGDSSKGIRIPHYASVQKMVTKAQDALAKSCEAFAQFKGQAEAMSQARCPSEVSYFNDILDAVLDVTAAEALAGVDALAAAVAMTEAEQKQKAREIKRREMLLEDMLTRHEQATNGVGGMRGTAWGVYNAATESANHSKLWQRYQGNDEARASRHFESVTAGRRDDVNQVALEKALVMAR